MSRSYKPARKRSAHALGIPAERGTYERWVRASDAAASRKCITALSGFRDLVERGKREEASHVFQDIVRFCIDPKNYK